MDWTRDTVVTAQVTDEPQQESETDAALIERFQSFFHNFTYESRIPYPYRHEIAERTIREEYIIELDLDDLRKAREDELVDAVKKTPARYLPLV